jgi:hypothetical protein
VAVSAVFTVVESVALRPPGPTHPPSNCAVPGATSVGVSAQAAATTRQAREARYATVFLMVSTFRVRMNPRAAGEAARRKYTAPHGWRQQCRMVFRSVSKVYAGILYGQANHSEQKWCESINSILHCAASCRAPAEASSSRVDEQAARGTNPSAATRAELDETFSGTVFTLNQRTVPNNRANGD